MSTTTVEYRLLSGTRAAVGRAGAHHVIADRPEGKAGGKGLGFNGGELLALAVGGCFCNDLQALADDMGVAIAGLKVTVSIDFDGTLTLNGTEVASLSVLERYLQAEGRNAEQRELHVRADQRAKYDTVAKVLAIAQRSGLKRIGIDGND